MVNTTNRNYLYKVDVLRGLAILMVFSIHALQLYTHGQIEVPTGESIWIRDFSEQPWYLILMTISPIGYGWTGVQLFFVISGFLIHLIHLRKETDNFAFQPYFIKRFFRIYPPYFFVLLITIWLAQDSFWETKEGLWRFFSHIILVHNLDYNVFFDYNGVFWSLAIEAQLYLIYPLFLWLKKQMGIKKTLALLTVLYFLCVISSRYFLEPPVSFFVDNMVFKHWIIWALGAYLAENYYKGKRTFNMSGKVLLLFFFLVCTIKAFPFLNPYIDFFWTLFYVALCSFYLFTKRKKPAGTEKVMIFFGESSYSLYLTHLPLMNFIALKVAFFANEFNHGSFYFFDTITLLICCQLLALVLYHILERPSFMFGRKILENLKYESIHTLKTKL